MQEEMKFHFKNIKIGVEPTIFKEIISNIYDLQSQKFLEFLKFHFLFYFNLSFS